MATVQQPQPPKTKIAVVGGGASGIFAAIAAATASDATVAAQVTVLEATSNPLTKVKISGGGRCNLLHDTSQSTATILQQGYPRGRRELQSPYSAKGFGPVQAQTWFETHGVTVKTEPDGRMFPVTDSSQTVMDALLGAAAEANVQIRLRCPVKDIVQQDKDDGTFRITLTDKTKGASKEEKQETFDAVILATGSAPIGYQLAQQLGHAIVSTVPSLFTLNTRHELLPETGRFHDLAGVSVPWVRLTLSKAAAGSQGNKKKSQSAQFQQEGPLLITHHGLSGPAALRLSAFGARIWHDLKYQATVQIHWAPHCGDTEQVMDTLWNLTSIRPKKTIASVCPLPSSSSVGEEDAGVSSAATAIPRRLWAALCQAAGIPSEQVWGQVSKKVIRQIALQVSACQVQVTGKGQFKEEFGTSFQKENNLVFVGAGAISIVHGGTNVKLLLTFLITCCNSDGRGCFVKRNQYEINAKQDLSRSLLMWRSH